MPNRALLICMSIVFMLSCSSDSNTIEERLKQTILDVKKSLVNNDKFDMQQYMNFTFGGATDASRSMNRMRHIIKQEELKNNSSFDDIGDYIKVLTELGNEGNQWRHSEEGLGARMLAESSDLMAAHRYHESHENPIWLSQLQLDSPNSNADMVQTQSFSVLNSHQIQDWHKTMKFAIFSDTFFEGCLRYKNQHRFFHHTPYQKENSRITSIINQIICKPVRKGAKPIQFFEAFKQFKSKYNPSQHIQNDALFLKKMIASSQWMKDDILRYKKRPIFNQFMGYIQASQTNNRRLHSSAWQSDARLQTQFKEPMQNDIGSFFNNIFGNIRDTVGPLFGAKTRAQEQQDVILEKIKEFSNSMIKQYHESINAITQKVDSEIVPMRRELGIYEKKTSKLTEEVETYSKQTQFYRNEVKDLKSTVSEFEEKLARYKTIHDYKNDKSSDYPLDFYEKPNLSHSQFSLGDHRPYFHNNVDFSTYFNKFPNQNPYEMAGSPNYQNPDRNIYKP